MAVGLVVLLHVEASAEIVEGLLQLWQWLRFSAISLGLCLGLAARLHLKSAKPGKVLASWREGWHHGRVIPIVSGVDGVSELLLYLLVGPAHRTQQEALKVVNVDAHVYRMDLVVELMLRYAPSRERIRQRKALWCEDVDLFLLDLDGGQEALPFQTGAIGPRLGTKDEVLRSSFMVLRHRTWRRQLSVLAMVGMRALRALKLLARGSQAGANRRQVLHQQGLIQPTSPRMAISAALLLLNDAQNLVLLLPLLQVFEVFAKFMPEVCWAMVLLGLAFAIRTWARIDVLLLGQLAAVAVFARLPVLCLLEALHRGDAAELGAAMAARHLEGLQLDLVELFDVILLLGGEFLFLLSTCLGQAHLFCCSCRHWANKCALLLEDVELILFELSETACLLLTVFALALEHLVVDFLLIVRRQARIQLDVHQILVLFILRRIVRDRQRVLGNWSRLALCRILFKVSVRRPSPRRLPELLALLPVDRAYYLLALPLDGVLQFFLLDLRLEGVNVEAVA